VVAGNPVEYFARRTVLVLILIAVFALIWYTADVYLLAFAGVLGAIVLDAFAGWLRTWLPLKHKGSYAAALITIFGAIALAFWLLAPRAAAQMAQLVNVLPKALDTVRTYLSSHGFQNVVRAGGISITGLLGTVTDLAKRAVYFVGGVIVIAVVAAYVGGNPLNYSRGMFLLFPASKREPARAVAAEVAYVLRWWLLGQLVPMIFLGIASGIGLWFLRIPLVFTLALLTGILVFIPYLGSFIAFIITLLVTLSADPAKIPWVVVLFLGIHIAEGYLLTPMVQRRAVYLPPALTILAQVTMGILLGFLGIALATPITAATLVLVKMLYLKKRPEHH
jgi:predicted PurR-regulated permease PerM